MAGHTSAEYAKGLARGFGGAMIFGFPLLMTMEMWWLGFYMDRLRLALFIALSLPILAGLSFFTGLEETFDWKDDVLDALSAFAIGVIAAAALLTLFGVIRFELPWQEVIGKIGVQAVPASIGAVLARKQMGGGGEEAERRREAGYAGELFLMMVGALFLAFNVAPTDEMVLIAQMMTSWHALALAAASLVTLHAFVYTVGFAGEHEPHGGAGFWRTFLHFTIAGYGIALVVSLYVLWTFERMAGLAPTEAVTMVVVLGFPAALGAALARLLV